MKKLKLVPLFLIAFLLCNFTVVAQEDEEEEEIIEIVEVENEVSTITGLYEGMKNGLFIFTLKDEEGDEDTYSFDKISPKAKLQFDLSKKEMIGKTFEVTYSNVNEEEEDSDGEIDYVSVKTILNLNKL
jgi:hypothetical protein